MLHALIVEILRCHRLRRIRNVVLTQAFEILDLVCLVENVFSKTRTLIAVCLRCFYTEKNKGKELKPHVTRIVYYLIDISPTLNTRDE